MRGRDSEDGLVVAEGPHLLEEALGGHWRIVQLVTTAAGRSKHEELLERAQAEVVEVSARAFESVSATEHSQQLLTLLQPDVWAWEDLVRHPALLIALDGIQDPGNAGTIVRSAEAFGATGVVFLKGCAHVANGKVLRASAGSIFRMPFLEGIGATDFLQEVQARGLALYALDARAEQTIDAIDVRRELALVIGNEGSGVGAELRTAAERVSIPTTKVESVNAAIACSIALFALQQQRNRT